MTLPGSSTSLLSARGTPKTRDPTTTGWIPTRRMRKMDALFDGAMVGPDDVRHPLLHGSDRLSVFPLRRGNHRQPVRCRQYEADDPHGSRRLSSVSNARAASSKGCIRRATSTRIAVSSCIFPMSCLSRVSVPAMAAMRYWARSAMRCESRATRRAPRAGSRSTCCSWASRAPRAKRIILPVHSRLPAARPTWQC